MVDLRSDTVTRPTQAMRAAMADAEVGDDAYGEDPTVRRLEDAYAELVGKEAGLFVPSGTMANQASLRVLGRPGTTILCGRSSHVASFEASAAGLNATAQLFPLDDGDGMLDPADVAFHVAAAAHHRPLPAAVAIENTAMVAGGRPWDLDRLRAVEACGLPVHLDGARLFNACVATGIRPSTYASGATVVWSALSKGLCAPVGSVMAGSHEVVDQLRVARHQLGGQLRQAGVLAAAGLIALTMIDRLVDDHERARRIADAVATRWPACGLDPSTVHTNMVVFRHDDTDALLTALASDGVLGGTLAPGVARLVTHHDVDDAGVERACKAIAAAP